MDKNFGMAIICTAILFLWFVGTASATTWSVDGSGGVDFTGIQDAIDNSSDGDTILVYTGVYSENVVVDKSVTLRGIGQPVVNAGRHGSAVTLTAEGITVEGFDVTNSGRRFDDAGIKVTTNNNIITGNNVSNNSGYGVDLRYSSNCIITGNTVSNNNYEGIDIRYSSNCIITGNNVSNNDLEGINIRYSSNCIITGNNVSNSDEGRCFQDSSSSDIKCMINCNYIHLFHSNNCTITGNSVNDNYIELFHSNNCTITGNSVNNSWRYGVHLESSCNNIITGNMVSHNDDGGIELFNSNNNTITGNNVRNNDDNGILFYSSSNNIITGNMVSHNDDGGICFSPCSNNNTITDNTFVNDGLFVGRSHQNTVEDNIVNGKPLVYLEEVSNYKVEDAGQVILLNCNNVTVENLDLSNTSVGIKLWKTEDSKISNNKVYNNSGYGIHLDGSSNNTITDNTVCNNNDDGIDLSSSSSNNSITGNTFVNDGLSIYGSYQNTVENNTVNGKPLVYLKEVSNYTVDDAGQVILVNCSNITVENLDLSNTSVGIYLWDTEDSTISNNKVCNNNCGVCLVSSSNNTISCNNASNNSGDGIYLSGSNNNTITGNHISNNNDEGICLRYSSNNNTFTGNNVCNNTYADISFELSNNNTLTGNNISSNYKSIDLYSSRNNKIYLNNFINNTDNVHYWSRTNIWNSTEKITYTYNGSTYTNYLGNYWSDYEDKYPDAEEIDTAGIWDMPYRIDGDKDNYPLLERFENYSISKRIVPLEACLNIL